MPNTPSTMSNSSITDGADDFIQELSLDDMNLPSIQELPEVIPEQTLTVADQVISGSFMSFLPNTPETKNHLRRNVLSFGSSDAVQAYLDKAQVDDARERAKELRDHEKWLQQQQILEEKEHRKVLRSIAKQQGWLNTEAQELFKPEKIISDDRARDIQDELLKLKREHYRERQMLLQKIEELKNDYQQR